MCMIRPQTFVAYQCIGVPTQNPNYAKTAVTDSLSGVNGFVVWQVLTMSSPVPSRILVLHAWLPWLPSLAFVNL